MFNLKFHHIGVATKNIDVEFKVFHTLGYKKISDVFYDEKQKIKGVFISSENQPTLELLENSDSNGPLSSHLNVNRKFYHFAYVSENIEKDTKQILEDTKGMLVVPIMSATYFDKICFIMLRNMMLIELVQLK